MTGVEVDPVARTARFEAGVRGGMAPWSTGGACLNFLAGPDVTTHQVRSAHLPADLERLREIEHRVDPGDTFRAVLPLG